MNKILIYLDGKKTYFVSITLLVIPFLTSQGLMSQELGALLAGIIAILMGGGKYITDQATTNGTELGNAVISNRK